jgi:hypothetical protein
MFRESTSAAAVLSSIFVLVFLPTTIPVITVGERYSPAIVLTEPGGKRLGDATASFKQRVRSLSCSGLVYCPSASVVVAG